MWVLLTRGTCANMFDLSEHPASMSMLRALNDSPTEGHQR